MSGWPEGWILSRNLKEKWIGFKHLSTIECDGNKVNWKLPTFTFICPIFYIFKNIEVVLFIIYKQA